MTRRVGRHIGRLDIGLDIGQFGLDSGVVVTHGVDPAEEFVEIQRVDADAGVFEQLLAVAYGVEGGRPRAQSADAQALEASDHTTGGCESDQILLELDALGRYGVELGQAEGHAVLAQVVAERHLAAEAVAAVGDGHDVDLVRRGLDQNRHVEAGPSQRVDHGALFAEVGQRDHDAVDLLAVGVEEIGALARVFHALDAAEGRLFGRQGDDLEPGRFQHLDHVRAALLTQMAGEEASIADDQSQCYRFHVLFLL